MSMDMERIRQALERNTGKVITTPQALAFIEDEDRPENVAWPTSQDYAAGAARNIAEAITTGRTAASGVRVVLRVELDIVDVDGEIDIVTVETRVNPSGASTWIDLE